jgi:hypothetical protein
VGASSCTDCQSGATSDPVGSHYYHHLFLLLIGMHRALPHAHSIVVQVNLLMETTVLLASRGRSAQPMLLCAHLARLTHFLVREPVRAHPVSPERHLFPYVNIFLF